MRRFLARRTDAATADDALAETLLVCWRRLDDVPADPLPWAYGVARFCLANAQRGARGQERLAAKIAVVDPPADQMPEPADEPELAEAMDALRPDDAELLRLWAWEQLSPAEIAEVLDITPNAASIRLTGRASGCANCWRRSERRSHLPDMRSHTKGGDHERDRRT